MRIVDLVIREYTAKDFNESVWRLKWEEFIHPHTNETGWEYLKRNDTLLPLNPKLQKGSPVIIVLEPLYGPGKSL